MLFKAYYADGAVYQGGHSEWVAMPASGVVFVVLHTVTGRTWYNGGDWYWADENGIGYTPSGEWGTDQPKPDIACQSCIKQGVGVSDELFKAISERAMSDDHLYPN